ncbi:hypothetical protein ACQR16_23165 [Bradyrhizobium oligotrophicum]|uniref:hypothetical protein n=1 Tax=Bradyrhizobium oligotrophicum TaxID=44255 RepID=UPI003EBD8155
MWRGAIGAAMLMLAMGSELQAAGEPGQANRISCSEVRAYVARYTAEVAEMYARSQGATDAQISRAKRCLTAPSFRRAERWRSYTE